MSSTAPIPQAVNLAYLASLPPQLRPLFSTFELGNPASPVLYFPLAPATQVALYEKLLNEGFAGFMITSIMAEQWDPYTLFLIQSKGGVTWMPPADEPGLGEPGQFSLPSGNPQQEGSLGAFPTTKPDGWISLPPIYQGGKNVLFQLGANVAELLAAWFPPFVEVAA